MRKGCKLKDICICRASNISLKDIKTTTGDFPLYGASGFVQTIDSYHMGTPYIGIVKDGSGVGRVNMYPAYSSLLGTMQYITPKDNCIVNYLYFLLCNLNLSDFARGAAIPHIYFTDYGNIGIKLHSLEQQYQIVEELDCLTSIIEKQKKQLEELDNLAQAIFYDMFGDPIENEKGWPKTSLGKEFKISSGGTPDTKNHDYWDNGNISWIGSNLCQNSILYCNDGKFITEEGLLNSSAKLYNSGYVLVALVGATIGKVAMLKFSTTTNQNIAGIDVNSNKQYTSEFIFYLSQALYPLFLQLGGDKFKMANLSFIRALPLITPPLSLQQEFASKIEAIEKQKELIKKSIKETEDLFNSRMDYYFN